MSNAQTTGIKVGLAIRDGAAGVGNGLKSAKNFVCGIAAGIRGPNTAVQSAADGHKTEAVDPRIAAILSRHGS
jgi:hypothetical protein